MVTRRIGNGARRPLSGQRPRRVRSWARTDISLTSLASGAVAHQELQSGLETDLGRVLGEYTVARSIVNIGLTGLTSTPDLMGMGIVIVGRDAAAAGTTSLPTPIQNQHADWLWWWCGYAGNTSIEVNTSVFYPVPRYVEADIRAMRKVQERDEVPVLVLENDTGGSTMQFGGSVSLLLLRS